MRTPYPPWDRVIAGLGLVDSVPTIIRRLPTGQTSRSADPTGSTTSQTWSLVDRSQPAASRNWPTGEPARRPEDARPPCDLTVIGHENQGFPILSWQWSPDDRLCHGGSYGIQYRQLSPGPYGIVVPGPVQVSSAGPAHRTIWDVYGHCIFGGTYEVSVSFVPPDRPASEWSEPIQVVIPEAF